MNAHKPDTPHKQQRNPAQSAQAARGFLAFTFIALFIAGYLFKADITSLQAEPIFVAVLASTLLTFFLLPKALLQETPALRMKYFKLLAVLDGVVVWACMIYYLLNTVL